MPRTAVKPPAEALEWSVSRAPVPYEDAVRRMETWVEEIAHGGPERVWLLEHPPLYTAGTSAKEGDLLDARFPVFKSGRGGEYTYHGPGQRVAYVMLDLKRRKPDVRHYVHDLEEWLIRTLASFGVRGKRRPGHIGVWVGRDDGLDKIAAIGVRVRRWVTFHGVALNVAPDLGHFAGIVPCGVRDGQNGVTSFKQLGVRASMSEVDAALQRSFQKVFGSSIPPSP